MKKALILLALAIPILAVAQLGNLVKTPKLDTEKVEDFTAEVEVFESKVDTAGDKLYTATDDFFAIVDSVTDLPAMNELWSDVKSDVKSAVTDEAKEAAEEGFTQYISDTEARKSTLDELWEDNAVRTEIIGHLISEKDALGPIQDDIEAALEMDKAAIGSYDELYKEGKEAVDDLAGQIAEKPLAAAGAKPVLEAGKDALETAKETKDLAQQHIELATYILDKIKAVFE